jgi:hypothetical protein
MSANKFTHTTFLFSKDKIKNLSKTFEGVNYTLHNMGKAKSKRTNFVLEHDDELVGKLANMMFWIGKDFSYVCEVENLPSKFITSFVLSEKFDAIYILKSKADEKLLNSINDSALMSYEIDITLRDQIFQLAELRAISSFDKDVLSHLIDERSESVLESLTYDLAFNERLFEMLNKKMRVFPLN